jgi:hypothetical protein
MPALLLQSLHCGRINQLFFDTREFWLALETQPGVREPCENRGRLRHCKGTRTPIATGSRMRRREGGSEVYALSQDIGLVVLVAVPPCGTTSPSKGRMRPACARVRSGFVNAFILRFAG